MKNLQKIRVLVAMTALSVLVLVVANIVSVKLWDFAGIAVDGGIVIFPLSYILGDLMMEIYGKKMANYVVFLSFGMDVLVTLIILVVGCLPAYPGWGGQAAYEAILGFTPRIMLGSLVAYLVSELMNNVVFEKIKRVTGEGKLWLRLLGSSAVARVADTVIFETVAFFGVLSAGEFILQAGFAYVAGFALEIILTPVTYWLVGKLKKYAI